MSAHTHIALFILARDFLELSMPEAFDKCVRDGGRVRTRKLKGGKYIHICFLKGKSYAGEVKKSEKKEGSK